MSDVAKDADTVLQFDTVFVCPRCTVIHAVDEGCSVCDYEGDLDEAEVKC